MMILRASNHIHLRLQPNLKPLLHGVNNIVVQFFYRCVQECTSCFYSTFVALPLRNLAPPATISQ